MEYASVVPHKYTGITFGSTFCFAIYPISKEWTHWGNYNILFFFVEGEFYRDPDGAKTLFILFSNISVFILCICDVHNESTKSYTSILFIDKHVYFGFFIVFV